MMQGIESASAATQERNHHNHRQRALTWEIKVVVVFLI
jgi:hypothetical protein